MGAYTVDLQVLKSLRTLRHVNLQGFAQSLRPLRLKKKEEFNAKCAKIFAKDAKNSKLAILLGAYTAGVPSILLAVQF